MYIKTKLITFFHYMVSKKPNKFLRNWKALFKKDFIIYRQILYLIDNCRIIEEDSTG